MRLFLSALVLGVAAQAGAESYIPEPQPVRELRACAKPEADGTVRFVNLETAEAVVHGEAWMEVSAEYPATRDRKPPMEVSVGCTPWASFASWQQDEQRVWIQAGEYGATTTVRIRGDAVEGVVQICVSLYSTEPSEGVFPLRYGSLDCEPGDPPAEVLDRDEPFPAQQEPGCTATDAPTWAWLAGLVLLSTRRQRRTAV